MNNKPYFFNGPLSGVLVQPAAYTFIYRFIENQSAEYPNGYRNSNVLKSFSITGEPGSFAWTEGHEKLSDNWYKRALGDEYTIPYFLDPEFLDIGGNTGETYTFNGVDIEDLTGGVFNAATLPEEYNLGCFALQFTQNTTPDILKGVISPVSTAVSTLNNSLDGVLTTLTCPKLEKLDMK